MWIKHGTAYRFGRYTVRKKLSYWERLQQRRGRSHREGRARTLRKARALFPQPSAEVLQAERQESKARSHFYGVGEFPPEIRRKVALLQEQWSERDFERRRNAQYEAAGYLYSMELDQWQPPLIPDPRFPDRLGGIPFRDPNNALCDCPYWAIEGPWTTY